MVAWSRVALSALILSAPCARTATLTIDQCQLVSSEDGLSSSCPIREANCSCSSLKARVAELERQVASLLSRMGPPAPPATVLTPQPSPPPLPQLARRAPSYSVVHTGSECSGTDALLGSGISGVDACFTLCRQTIGCLFFLYGTNNLCYHEVAASSSGACTASTNAPYTAYRMSYEKVHSGSECVGTDTALIRGSASTPDDCYHACRATVGCVFFLYGTNGYCYNEAAASSSGTCTAAPNSAYALHCVRDDGMTLGPWHVVCDMVEGIYGGVVHLVVCVCVSAPYVTLSIADSSSNITVPTVLL